MKFAVIVNALAACWGMYHFQESGATKDLASPVFSMSIAFLCAMLVDK